MTLRGLATARGVAIGPIFRLDKIVDLERIDYQPNLDPAQEHADLRAALDEARREIADMREIVRDRFGPEFAAVFHAQIQILEDKGFVQNLTQGVDRTHNARDALRGVLATYRQTFDRIEDPYFRERVTDIEDVGQRVMESLLGERHHTTPLSEGAIVVANNLLPGMFARLEVENIAAIVQTVRPDVLLVDEALAVGDARFQQKCIARIRGFLEEGSCLVFVSHDPQTVRSLCSWAEWIQPALLAHVGERRYAIRP